MVEEKNVAQSDIERQALHNIAKAEHTPLKVDRSIPGHDMALMTIIVVIAIICTAFSIVASFSAPSNKDTSSSSMAIQDQDLATYKIDGYTELPEGVAAIVNGVEIPESRVTDYIEAYRVAMGLNEDEDKWAQYVYEGETYGTTENLRNYILEMMINHELVVQAGAELGLEVTDEQIDEVIEQDMQNRNIESKEKYWEIVLSSGYNEDVFISQNRNNLLQNEIVYLLNPESGYADTLDEQVLAYIKQSYPAYREITSLDEVSENMQQSALKYVVWILNVRAYNGFMYDFIEESGIEVAAPPKDLPYAVDTGKLQLQGLIDQFKRKIEIQSQLGGESMDNLQPAEDNALENPLDDSEEHAEASEGE